MNLITLKNISVNLAGREIFHDLSWSINNNDRFGLIGPNGAGKSTLLKVLSGKIYIGSGSITRLPEISIGYLPQTIQFESARTLQEIALELPPKMEQVENDLQRIEKRLENPDIHKDMPQLTRILDRQARALALYDYLEIGKYANKIQAMLTLLGFTPNDYLAPGVNLSASQKKMVVLAKLAIENPDLLLLDEPDNHLDFQGKKYLEAFIHNYKGAVIIVSHDRYLLDEVATQIAELENGQFTTYMGNYSAYKSEKEIRQMRQQQLYVTQQKEIARIEEAIKRFEYWAYIEIEERHIKQARCRRRMLERMEDKGEIIKKAAVQKVMNFRLDGCRGSSKAIEIVDLGISFGKKTLFRDIKLQVFHGDRIGLVGPNGSGKSVLFKLIVNQLEPQKGEIKLGPSTKIGYYAQEHQSLDGLWDRTPLELIRNIKPFSENAAVAQLVKFAFVYDQVNSPIKTLSGGERSRLQLLTIMLENPNCLLLDEPTNNLDISSMEMLEQALEDFDGALIIISHDRFFLDQTVDKIIELKDGCLNEFIDGYTDYQNSMDNEVKELKRHHHNKSWS